MTATLASDTFRQVRLLTLNEGHNGESTIFRLEKGIFFLNVLYMLYFFPQIINLILNR